MVKKFCFFLLIFTFLCPAVSIEASPATIKKVFEYVDAYYVEPVNALALYAKALDQIKNNFPGNIRVKDLSKDNFRISCRKTATLHVSNLDQLSNIRQMEKIIQVCMPEKDLKKLHKSQLNDEQITLDLVLGSLDPHSSYMSPEMYKELNAGMQGRFGGIGAEITVQNKVVTVVSPIDDTPAFFAGIKSGDQIIKINGASTRGMTAWEAVKKIRGPEKTRVQLTILHKDSQEPKQFDITRAIINIKTVKYKLYEDHVAYIRLSSFQEKTAADLRTVLREINEKARPLKGLLLDMRNNPGGLLDQAVKVSDQFMKSGVIVSTRGRGRASEITIKARYRGDEPTYPIVVLVNEGTASAAEIVSGALQDNRKGLVLGTRTFGKGSVQTVFPLGDGSAIKLTTAKYYTPNGRVVHEHGIIPDVVVGTTEGFREKDLNHFRKQDLAELKRKAESRTTQDLEIEKEAQLQAGLRLLQKVIETDDLQKGLQAYNSASKH